MEPFRAFNDNNSPLQHPCHRLTTTDLGNISPCLCDGEMGRRELEKLGVGGEGYLSRATQARQTWEGRNVETLRAAADDQYWNQDFFQDHRELRSCGHGGRVKGPQNGLKI